MALKRAPQYRVDAPIVFVHPDDDAWDMQRVRDEQSEMDKRGEDYGQHPVVQYLGGFTRYDLTANAQLGDKLVSPADYLLPEKEPTRWHLKRLSFQEWYQVQPSWERAIKDGERAWEAYTRCCRIGIKKVENGPELEGPPGTLTSKDMQTLHDISQTLVLELGEAVYTASLPLTESEKKQ